MLPIRLISQLALLAFASASASLSVNVYEGPTECTDENKVKNGDNVSIHYIGTFDQSSAVGEWGKQFDSSRDRGQTFGFTVGDGRVIKGWDLGIAGLCVGSKADLIVPPDMGYEDLGATLHFDVEVVDIPEGPAIVPGRDKMRLRVMMALPENDERMLKVKDL